MQHVVFALAWLACSFLFYTYVAPNCDPPILLLCIFGFPNFIAIICLIEFLLFGIIFSPWLSSFHELFQDVKIWFLMWKFTLKLICKERPLQLSVHHSTNLDGTTRWDLASLTMNGCSCSTIHWVDSSLLSNFMLVIKFWFWNFDGTNQTFDARHQYLTFGINYNLHNQNWTLVPKVNVWHAQYKKLTSSIKHLISSVKYLTDCIKIWRPSKFDTPRQILTS